MNVDSDRVDFIKAIFNPLSRAVAAKSFPAVGSLSSYLESQIVGKDPIVVTLRPKDASLFATAAVDAWLRAVHSFLISASLTHASPLWASVAGYYSSHYSVRSIAHLLGYFLLFQRKKIAHVEWKSGQYKCSLATKHSSDREHQFYWRVVKKDPLFSGDRIFTDNSTGQDQTDVGHRDRANYADHLSHYPEFRTLDKDTLKASVASISQVELSSSPIPCRSKYPDIMSVQLIAYHRLIRCRELLDLSLGAKHKFWQIHRIPSWTAGTMTFQVAEPRALASIGR